MEPKTVLTTHLKLCEEVYSLLLRENTWLKKEGKVPEMSLLNEKKEIISRLNGSLGDLKKLKPEFFSPFDNTKKLVADSHSRLLQIFYLDRENEDLLLKLNQSFDRENFARFTTDPDELGNLHKR